MPSALGFDSILAVMLLGGLVAACSDRSTAVARGGSDGGSIAADAATVDPAKSEVGQGSADVAGESGQVEDVAPTAGHDGNTDGSPLDERAGADAAPAGRICSPEHWCWTNPLPAGGLQGSWSYSKNDAWLVGRQGLILRWQSGGWSRYESGTTANLNAVWGLDTSEAWAVGSGGTTLHWNGIAWSAVASPVTKDLKSVFGTAADDAWAVGGETTSNRGTIIHWDGTAWTTVFEPDTTLYRVWAASRTRAWAVGFPGVLAWDGATWSSAIRFSMFGIWGTSESDVWAVGSPDSWEYPQGRGSHAHWDGRAWTFAPEVARTPPTSYVGPSLTSAWGTESGDVWATTDTYGWIAHFDTKTITIGSIPGNPDSMTGAQFGGGTGGAVFATSNVGIAQFDGTDWAIRSSGVVENIYGLWMHSPSDGWALVSGSVAHWDGATWSLAATSSLPTTFYDIHGTAADDVWAVGALGVVMHWNGRDWTAAKLASPQYINHVWGSSPRDVWATATEAGKPAALLHYDGTAWTVGVATPMPPSDDVWGTAADDVWVISSNGYVLHFDGAEWTAMATGMANADAIGGSGPRDVWVAGHTEDWRFQIVHWDGEQWEPSPGGGTVGQITALAAAGPSDAWAVGYQGAVGHWDGTAWSKQSVGCDSDLPAVAASPDGTFWVGGLGGVILRRGPGNR